MMQQLQSLVGSIARLASALFWRLIDGLGAAVEWCFDLVEARLRSLGHWLRWAGYSLMVCKCSIELCWLHLKDAWIESRIAYYTRLIEAYDEKPAESDRDNKDGKL